jgi:chromosome segregation protein
MISRMVEAKPEEMRTFLEEAAGISKYKERRRETSNRIRHTKDNLDRLHDVLEEIEKQIKHLDRQAKMAGRYERLKDKERKTAAELLALRLRDLDERASQSGATLREKETVQDALIAEQRKIEAHIEEVRIKQSERSDEFSEVQGRFYKSGSEIARVEQTIEHAHELRERQQRDLEQATRGATEIAEHINSDQSQIAQLEMHLSELVPGLEQAKQSEKRSIESLEQAEQALADWQQKWDESTLAWNEALQTRNVEETRAEQIQSRIGSLTERQKKLDESQQTAKPEDLKTEFEKLSAKEQLSRQAREDFDQAITENGEQILKLREQDAKLIKLVDERRDTLQAAQAKYASLEAVQQAALGAGDEAIQGWLESTGYKDSERVAKLLDVESGWETPVETVLGNYLQAVCVDDANAAAASLAQLRSGNMTLLVDTSSAEQGNDDASTLASKVTGAPGAVLEILRSVRVAESLNKALAIREQLNQLDADSSVITKEGVWLSRNWLRVCRDKDAAAGVLGREHDMRRLKGEIRELKARSDSAEKLLTDGRYRLTQLEKSRDKLQSGAAKLMSDYSELKVELDAVGFRVDQANARRAAITAEAGDIENEHIAAEEQLRESRSEITRATDRLAELEEQRTTLEAQQEELKTELQRVKAQADEDRMQAHDLAIQFETRRSNKESAAQSLARMESQLEQFGSREQEIRRQLEQSEAPLEANKKDLANLLEIRITVESELGEARRRVEEVEDLFRELDQNRMLAAQSVEESQGAVNEARMAAQEIRGRVARRPR